MTSNFSSNSSRPQAGQAPDFVPPEHQDTKNAPVARATIFFFVHHPIKCCCFCWFILLALAYVVQNAIVLSTDDSRTWMVDSDVFVEYYDAHTLAVDDNLEVQASRARAVPQSTVMPTWTYTLYFRTDSASKWILTKSNIEKILQYEDMVLTENNYDKYCYAPVNPTECLSRKSQSLAFEIANHSNYSSWTLADIQDYVYSQSRSRGAAVYQHFNKDYPTSNRTWFYRTIFLLGGPIPTSANATYKESSFLNQYDRPGEQDQKYKDEYGMAVWHRISGQHNAQWKDGPLHVVAFAVLPFQQAWSDLLLSYNVYSAGSVIFVVFYMFVHLHSAFLAIAGIFQIMMAFVPTIVLYKYLYGINEIGFLNFLIIYVLLGLGADDIFVLVDAFHQSEFMVLDREDLEERVVYSFDRAAKAMAVTTATTFFAFLGTAISPLIPISAFGIWAATVILMNYLLVITLYPSMLIIWHLYIAKYEEMFGCCLCYPFIFLECCQEKSTPDRYVSSPTEKEKPPVIDDDDDDVLTLDLSTSKKTQMTRLRRPGSTQEAISSNSQMKRPSGGDTPDEDDSEDEEAKPMTLKRQSTTEEVAVEYRLMERFFGLYFSEFVIQYKTFILVFFVVLGGLAAAGASQMKVLQEAEQFFPEDHYLTFLGKWPQEFYSGQQDNVKIHLTWGLKTVDRSGTNRFNGELGKPVYDDNFDVSLVASQQYLIDVCNRLRLQSLVDQGLTPAERVTCFFESFGAWLNQTTNGTKTYPFVANDPANQRNEFNRNLYDWLQTEQQFLVAGTIDVRKSGTGASAVYDIKIIAFEATTPLKSVQGTSNQELAPIRDAWLDFAKSVEQNCPTGARTCHPVVASHDFASVSLTDGVILSAVQGVGSAFPLSFLILLFATRNWILSIFAIVNILGVMATEMAIMFLAGWQFGISESVAIIIMIGFSVDYVVHLSHAYEECEFEEREERLKYSLLTMGISIVAGSVTTMGAGFFLIIPEMLFYRKMSVLIMTTSFSSLFWSFLFFMSLLACCGPEGETGRISCDSCTKCNPREEDGENGEKKSAKI